VQKFESKNDKAEEVPKDRKKEQGRASRELAKLEQEIREVVSTIIPFESPILESFIYVIHFIGTRDKQEKTIVH
jgi:hypothetical protein